MTTRALPWTSSPSVDVEALPVGKWWDAVSVPLVIGNRALTTLGRASGAVIQDETHGKMYWLIGVDTARSWHLRQVRVLTELADETTLLGVPPAHWGPERRTYWRLPLTPDRYLTDTWRLHDALDQAVLELLGPAPDGRQLCYRCQLPTDEPIPVAMEHTGSVAGVTIYVCPKHTSGHSRDLSAAFRTRPQERS
ncbi:hypothetical protein ABZS86_22155 [Streptomyces sp. NPDC005355]|uniref:hypothetical protein n=1 Tax=Streptomyces sp. NPDC005355 TaxID=3157038 RepID=UPI0033B64BCF